MMLDSSSSSDSAAADAAALGGQVQPQRRAVGAVAHAQDGGAGGYTSGGWARGKRSTMEDFYDVKITEIDGQARLLAYLVYLMVMEDHALLTMALSEDHKPNRSDERRRIENAGGVVIWAGTWRVGGVLAMSHAFGNRLLKPFVVAEPEIQEEHVNGDLECLVLASDGLWDVVENEEAVSLAKTEDLPESAARKLTEIAYSRGSADNITCIVVQFHHDRG
uniref:protein-serine/threonine phosphatase n=1 Tax=Leersia perrieri TaxID=77586 RepID=A0A0D9XB61_9ORYZ